MDHNAIRLGAGCVCLEPWQRGGLESLQPFSRDLYSYLSTVTVQEELEKDVPAHVMSDDLSGIIGTIEEVLQ